jgi:hypothetical protein
MSFEEDEHSRLYSTSKMTEGHCWRIHELTDTAGIGYGVCRESRQKIWTCATLLWGLLPNCWQMIKSNSM